MEKIQDRPVSIFNAEKADVGIISYQADVKRLYSNDRNGTNMEQISEYRLSLKLINDELITRIDFEPSDMGDGVARTIISNSKETVIYRTDSNEIENRIPLNDTAKRLMSSNVYRSLMGRIDLDLVAQHSRSMAFDVIDETPGLLIVNVPQGALPDIADGYGYSSRVASYSIRYDTVESVEISSEMEMHEADGTIVRVSSYPLYKEYAGNLLKVGQVMISAFDLPGELDVSDSVVDPLDLEPGTFVLEGQDRPILLGDPSSPDKTETYVELYEDIQLNTLSDSFFRMNF